MVTTIFCSVTSCTLFVFGTSTSMLDWRMGAVIMKMISKTRTTSMNGTMLISDKDDCVDLDICGIGSYARPGWRAADTSLKSFFDLRGDFQRKGVKTLRKVANVLQELIVENNGRDCDEKSRCGGQQSFRNARSDRAKACGTRVAQARKSV